MDAIWQSELEVWIADTLSDAAGAFHTERLVLVALDIHPWSGHIGLAALTERERAADQELADPAEMAAWEHFSLASQDHGKEATRALVGRLAAQMRSAYEATPSPDRADLVDAYLTAGGRALRAHTVQAALKPIAKTPDFGVSCAHPDTGAEFVGPR